MTDVDGITDVEGFDLDCKGEELTKKLLLKTGTMGPLLFHSGTTIQKLSGSLEEMQYINAQTSKYLEMLDSQTDNLDRVFDQLNGIYNQCTSSVTLDKLDSSIGGVEEVTEVLKANQARLSKEITKTQVTINGIGCAIATANIYMAMERFKHAAKVSGQLKKFERKLVDIDTKLQRISAWFERQEDQNSEMVVNWYIKSLDDQKVKLDAMKKELEQYREACVDMGITGWAMGGGTIACSIIFPGSALMQYFMFGAGAANCVMGQKNLNLVGDIDKMAEALARSYAVYCEFRAKTNGAQGFPDFG
jgi:hypothetical protein